MNVFAEIFVVGFVVMFAASLVVIGLCVFADFRNVGDEPDAEYSVDCLACRLRMDGDDPHALADAMMEHQRKEHAT